ncbi:hypothetical protein Vadar_010334 [Vaccinium darrowii]|uniref:Uncharacterized protein n=1 Tax=Vaccinium darrowii TaxID=229202 RepID=A0ACB7XGI3_9ERIC|nr:hypothetical protein Vadar_010334 [Vaccinium darrowii]
MLRGMFKKKHKESQSNKSLVDISFESDQYFDPGDGVEITKLAMRCVEEKPVQRPTMKEVVCCLRGLNVVKKFGHLLPKMSVGSSVGDILPQEYESATALVEYNYEALASITGGFSEENFIGDTLFGEVFRGKIQQAGLETQEVVVKIWVREYIDAALSFGIDTRIGYNMLINTMSCGPNCSCIFAYQMRQTNCS